MENKKQVKFDLKNYKDPKYTLHEYNVIGQGSGRNIPNNEHRKSIVIQRPQYLRLGLHHIGLEYNIYTVEDYEDAIVNRKTTLVCGCIKKVKESDVDMLVSVLTMMKTYDL